MGLARHMTLRVVGAGLGRTGTMSLKAALERLLDGPCYHMIEVFARPHHVPMWHAAVNGEPVDWDEMFDGFTSAVDWPVGAFWREIGDAYPDAKILLSSRDGTGWWNSFDKTILENFRRGPTPGGEIWFEMVSDLLHKRFTENFTEEKAAVAAYEHHNDTVRSTVPADRLIDWRPGDGWEPLCAALGVPVPDEPFPHTNTTEEFRSRFGVST
jgi:hypothetical protein